MSKQNSKEVAKRSLATIVDYKQTFSTPHGKRVLKSILKSSGIWHSSFVQGDPYSTAFNEGTRKGALDILSKLNTDIKQLKTLLKEGEQHEDELW